MFSVQHCSPCVIPLNQPPSRIFSHYPHVRREIPVSFQDTVEGEGKSRIIRLHRKLEFSLPEQPQKIFPFPSPRLLSGKAQLCHSFVRPFTRGRSPCHPIPRRLERAVVPEQEAGGARPEPMCLCSATEYWTNLGCNPVESLCVHVCQIWLFRMKTRAKKQEATLAIRDLIGNELARGVHISGARALHVCFGASGGPSRQELHLQWKRTLPSTAFDTDRAKRTRSNTIADKSFISLPKHIKHASGRLLGTTFWLGRSRCPFLLPKGGKSQGSERGNKPSPWWVAIDETCPPRDGWKHWGECRGVLMMAGPCACDPGDPHLTL